MSRVVRTELVDDISGEPADETVTFGIDGNEFEIDLTSNRAGVLRDIMGDYVEHGRKIHARRGGKATVSAPSRQSKVSREQTAAVRAWARSNGWPELPGRGRIPFEVQKAFDAAHVSKLAAVG